MSGFLTNGVSPLSLLTGAETLPLDTNNPIGQMPESASVVLRQLAQGLKLLGNTTDETTVAGSRYFTSVAVNYTGKLTGIQVLVGSTGGTDKWLVELHDSKGALVATSATAGVTVGAAGTVMQIAFTAPYNAAPGTYFLVIQSNGTTAKIAAWNYPGLPLLTGSATGTFGTGAAITPPTAYTAGQGPFASLY